MVPQEKDKRLSKTYQECLTDLELSEAYLKPILNRLYELRVRTKEIHFEFVSHFTNMLMTYKHRLQEMNQVLTDEMDFSQARSNQIDEMITQVKQKSQVFQGKLELEKNK